MDDQTPTPADDVAASFSGHTAGRAAAIRAGIVLGGALVVAIGAAVALGASPNAGPSGAGAQPSAPTTNPGTVTPRGNGFGRGGFVPGPFGMGPFGLGPSTDAGPGLGKGDRPGLAFGRITVTAISGSNVSLATEDGWTRTISVTSETTITKGGQPAKLGDLEVGDVVRFAQKRNANGTFTVTALAIIQPQVAGTVTAIASDSITFTGRDGTSQTIKTNGSTTYHRGGANGARTDVKVGSRIVASGDRAADGTITASSVTVILPRVVGTVSAVGADSITISRRDGTSLTIHVGSDTTIGVAGVGTAKIGDIKAGMVVVAEGVQRSDGSLDATAIRAGQPGKIRGADKGPKAAPGASAEPSTSQG